MQVLLVSAFTVSGHCYVSQGINCFTKSFRVANIKNAGFSKLKTRFLHFETQFVQGSSIVPVLSHHAVLLKPSQLISGRSKGLYSQGIN